MARRILLLGATGTIGRACAAQFAERGHDVVGIMRARPKVGAATDNSAPAACLTWRSCDVTDPESLSRDGIRGEHFDVIVSCLASRNGAPADAWAIDHRAHLYALHAAQAAGIRQFVLLSAICVQKPLLEFQKAKLAFERELIASGLTYSIVRPTAFFKSLSGQVERVKAGKPFLVFGDGTLTRCKPISDRDLACYIADCLDDESRKNKILPIGGPGSAITPRDQAAMLFELLGSPPRIRSVPLALLDGIIGSLATLGMVAPALRDKAEFARIGRYYATESMLVLNPATGHYDAEATPAAGTETLRDHYVRLIRGEAKADLADHAVF
jgi:divinyl chlorophyllide a 8-vinyl-reductase